MTTITIEITDPAFVEYVDEAYQEQKKDGETLDDYCTRVICNQASTYHLQKKQQAEQQALLEGQREEQQAFRTDMEQRFDAQEQGKGKGDGNG